MWERLEFLAIWGWWRRLQDSEGQVVSSTLSAPYSPAWVLPSLCERWARGSRLGKLVN